MKSPSIVIVKKSTPQARKEINHLLSQLSLTQTPPKPLTAAQFASVLAQKNVFFLAARASKGADEKIIGFLVIYLIQLPSGLGATAEDLIVDKPYRKWGIGRVLIEHGISLAEKKHARHVSLRTNPKRIQANKLYPQVGMRLIAGNFYRIHLPRM